MFENKSGKTIILKNMGVAVSKSDSGGTWLLNLAPNRSNTLRIGKGEKLYARQYNSSPMKYYDGGGGGLLATRA